MVHNIIFWKKYRIYTVNIVAIPVLIVLMILEMFKADIQLTPRLFSKILKMFFIPLSYIGETFEKLKQAIQGKLKINIDTAKHKKIRQIIKAICITVPIVVIIILLLSSADEIFGSIFTKIIQSIFNSLSHIQMGDFVVRLILIVCAFIYLLCFFDYITFRYEKEDGKETTMTEVKDNFTIKVLLGTLNIIYLIFCIIQVKSLFMRDVNINYAQYARQGFFQLMIVSLINLVTILIAKNREKEQNYNKYIRIMCLLMVAFTFIILLSSAVRMYFYESIFGYTLLRLLVYCSLFTEAILLIPTIMYIIDKKINLVKTYLTIVIIIYVCINFANFDNIIAKRNIDRYIETGKIDIYYLEMQTSTDAINQMFRILETNTNLDNIKQETKKYLNTLYDKLKAENMDFRDANISKIFAKNLIEKRLITIPDVTTNNV